MPPPMPAVTNTMLAPVRNSLISLSFSRADSSPTSGLAPAPRPLVRDFSDQDLLRGADGQEVLGVGVDGAELGSANAGVDAPVDGVAAAAAASYDLDADIQRAAIRRNSSSVALTAGAGAGRVLVGRLCRCRLLVSPLPFAGCLIPAFASASFTNELGISASLSS